MKQRKKVSVRRVVSLVVFVTMVISTIAVVIAMILAPSVPTEGYVRVKSDYVLMLLQSILGIFAMLLPACLSRKWGVELPSFMMILYALFLFCSIYLGEVRGFYYLIPHWDTFLHAFSGVALGALGFSVLRFLNKADNVPFHLSPAFVAVFAFCFAVSVDVLWEIYEYAVDGLLAMNMQKHALEGGTPLVGRAALNDTMTDLIVDSMGALFMAIVGYISLKFKKGWIEKWVIDIRSKNLKA